jgi:ABC-type glycerol-3-phosphate transport system substrate-binding protein
MKDSHNKDAAWRYLEFWFSRERQEQYFSLRGPPLYRARYLGRFGLYAGEPPWIPLRSDLDVEARIDEEMERTVRPLDRYVVRTPQLAAWPEAAQAMAEVFVDYYLDRDYADAAEALDEAERRFIDIVDVYRRQVDMGSEQGERGGGSRR